MSETERKESDRSETAEPKKELRVDQETLKDLTAKQGEQVKGGIPPKLPPGPGPRERS